MFQDDFPNFFANFLSEKTIDFKFSDGSVFEIGHLKIKYLDKIGAEKSWNEKAILIWKDQWLSHPKIVMSRLCSLLKLNDKIPARVCEIRRISQPVSDEFLNKNHLQQSVGSKIKYGLHLPKAYFRLLPTDVLIKSEDLLLAVMTFSGGKKYYFCDKVVLSFELIRFSNLNGFNIIGGFSKMLNHFIREKKPGNIMTYIDADWSDGENFSKLGFELVEKTSPIYFCLDENLNRKKVKDKSEADVMNSGSYKYILSEF